MEIDRIDRRTIYVPYYRKGRVKVKIVSCNDDFHKTYFKVFNGVTGWPFTLPFMTKWVLERVCINEESLMEQLRAYVACDGPITIIFEDEK